MTESVGNPETVPPETAEPPRRRRRSWPRLALTLLLQLLLVAFLLLGWVLGTQSGLRFALGLAEDLTSGLLRVEQADGRVLGDLHLDGVAVRAPDLSLDVGSFDLRWRPLGLFTGTLRILELSARDIDIEVAPAEQEVDSGPISLPAIVLPLSLELEQALVERLRIGAPGAETPFRVDRAALAASLRGSELTLTELSVSLPEPLVNAQAQGGVQLDGRLSARAGSGLGPEPRGIHSGEG